MTFQNVLNFAYFASPISEIIIFKSLERRHWPILCSYASLGGYLYLLFANKHRRIFT